MAKRGTTKRLSVDHENYVASKYNGRRSPSSGASVVDLGDVSTPTHLIECKATGSPTSPLKRTPTIISQMEKIAVEAYSESKEPILALRYYLPDSNLSGTDGYIDLAVHILEEDALNVTKVS